LNQSCTNDSIKKIEKVGKRDSKIEDIVLTQTRDTVGHDIEHCIVVLSQLINDLIKKKEKHTSFIIIIINTTQHTTTNIIITSITPANIISDFIMSKTKPITPLVRTSASFRHDNILAIAILGVIFCIQCYHQQSFVVNAFTTLHHHHRAYQGVTKLSPVPTVISSTPAAPRTTRTVSLQGFFGGMFGEAAVDQKKDEKKDKLLAEYDVGTFKDVDVQFESLSDYIVNKWAPLFLSGNIKLTTDVELVTLPPDSNNEDKDGVETVAGCQLIFKKSDTGYVSKSEEGDGSYQRQTAATSTTEAKGSYQSPPTTGNNNNNNGNSEKKATTKKKDEKKQGGVEVLVEKLSSSSLQVRAKRCEVDDDTMIKEMSEEVIIQELKKAIGIWKKKS
jgi:hypothetical protein